jgi:hypothetical protein
MTILIRRDGTLRCLYGEAIDLADIGHLAIERASHVEPDATGRWIADLTPVSGPILGPYAARSLALAAEAAWIEENRLP